MTLGRIGMVAAVAIALAWGVERLVVTDAEAVEAVLEQARAAVEKDDWAAFEALVAEDYAERGLDRQGLVRWARGLWQASRSRTLGLDVDAVRVEGDRAAARAAARPGAPWAGLRFPGRVELARSPAGWRVVSVVPDDAALRPPPR